MIFREIELNNQLNDIQSGAYQQNILQLREALAGKSQALADLAEETAKLKTNLLQSTVEYNEIIRELKEQVMELNAEKKAVAMHRKGGNGESEVDLGRIAE